MIVDSPSGEAGWIWHQVQPEVAKQTRACVYDRAGFGFSDSASRPNTSQNAVDDLHQLLASGNVKPPYVLVGNSLGGANVQVYAYRYPKEVAGLVLVEAQHEDETKRLNAVTQGKIGQVYAMQKEQNNFCLMASKKGFKPGSEKLQKLRRRSVSSVWEGVGRGRIRFDQHASALAGHCRGIQRERNHRRATAQIAPSFR